MMLTLQMRNSDRFLSRINQGNLILSPDLGEMIKTPKLTLLLNNECHLLVLQITMEICLGTQGFLGNMDLLRVEAEHQVEV